MSGPVITTDVAAAVAALARGEAIGLPTETVYGLAADAANAAAVGSIYRIKGRPTDHPLIVHVLGRDEARLWAQWLDDADRLAEACWPGPLTMILPRRPDAPPWACAGQATIGLRAPSHPLARAVLTGLRAHGITGLAAPSANRFGRVSPTRAEHVRADLGDDIALVLDGGSAAVGVESTIIDLSGRVPRLLRPGHLTAADLARVLGKPVLTPAAALAGTAAASAAAPTAGGAPVNAGDAVDAVDEDVPRAPGMLASHYAPVTPLQVLPRAALGERLRQALAGGMRVAVWARPPWPDRSWQPDRQPGPGLDPAAPVYQPMVQPMPTAPEAVEQTLYATLRGLDAAGVDLILVEAPENGPAWAAVRDRLTRASVQS